LPFARPLRKDAAGHYRPSFDGIFVAKTPTRIDTAEDRQRRRDEQRAAEDAALRREIDEAVRQDDLTEIGRRYGALIASAIVIALVAFGAFLWYQQRQETAMEQHSEALVAALDQVEAGNLAAGSAALQPLVDEGGGVAAIAQLQAAGIALEDGNPRRAVELFEAVAQDADAPDEFRSLARLRQVAVQFDALPPAEVVTRLRELATPGSPYFGSAGELVAMALLEQGREDEAGALFAEVATDPTVPESIRARTRQMAGLLGVDTVEDAAQLLSSAPAAQPVAQ
jgi:hypothetical protein